jgi:hypothetical protein
MGPAVVHKSIGKRGAPAGNKNAQKRMNLPDWLKLETSDDILRFMREILIPQTLAGRIGTRACSALTTACKCLLDYAELQELEKRVEALETKEIVKS